MESTPPPPQPRRTDQPPDAPALGRVPKNRAWVWPLALGIGAFFIVHPFDGPLSVQAARLSASLGGDLKRELFAWQQYGQGFALIVTAMLIFQLDPRRRIRLFDLLLTVILAQVASQVGKMLIGRPRPREWFEDPRTFLGPLGEYPMKVKGEWKLLHAWDIRGGAGADLWSMPSSHTLFAAALSVFLGAVYPRIRVLAFALAAIVGLGRVLFDAHWPTDVIVGGAIGWAIAAWVVHNQRGVRLFGRFQRGESGHVPG